MADTTLTVLVAHPMGRATDLARIAAVDPRVNCVAPASIDTPQAIAKLPPTRREELGRAAPLGRLGQADDVAGIVLVLASGLSAYVTGQTVMVDGGLSCTSARPPAGGR